MSRYSENLKQGKSWEIEVSEWLQSKGMDVELHVSYDATGKESCQLYVFTDGNQYPHPDMTVSRKNSSIILTYYIEVKSYNSFYKNIFKKVPTTLLNEEDEYLSIHKYQFDSYLQLSRWKEMECEIFFCVEESRTWYYQNIEILNKNLIMVDNAYYPHETGTYYFFNKSILKRARKY